MVTNTEREHAIWWWTVAYPEGVANYNKMLEEGMEQNLEFVRRWVSE